MSSWLAPLRLLLECNSGDLTELAESVGANPTIFYVGCDLSRCDLRGQDLRGLDLTNAKITPEQLDDNTRIDPDFDPRLYVYRHYIQIAIREEVFALALAYSDSSSYIYKAWALKSLIEAGAYSLKVPSIDEAISQSGLITDLYRGDRGKIRRFTLQIYPMLQDKLRLALKSGDLELGKYPYNKLIVRSLVSTKIGTLHERGNDLTLEELYPGFEQYLAGIRSGKRFIR